MNSTLVTSLAVGVSGLSVGWLVGLSVSPVVQVVITSLTGLAASAAAVVSGLQPHKPPEGMSDERRPLDVELATNPNGDRATGRVVALPNPTAKTHSVGPLVALCVGLALGAPVGIVVRTHNWLGVAPVASTSRDQPMASGTQRVSTPPSPAPSQIGGLYTATSDIRAACAKLANLDVAALFPAAQASPVCEISGCTSRETDPAAVKKIVDDICSTFR